MKIRQGDTVLIISGKDKGKKGTVLRVLHERNKIVVAGANMRTKFTKKTTQSAGQKIQFEAALPVSNVMMLDPKTGKPTRVGFRIENGKKVRFAKVSGTVIGRVSAKAEAKDTKEKKEVKEEKATTKKSKKEDVVISEKPKRAPFWKKIGFGAEALNNEPDAEAPKTTTFDTPPTSQQHVRGAGRGS